MKNCAQVGAGGNCLGAAERLSQRLQLQQPKQQPDAASRPGAAPQTKEALAAAAIQLQLAAAPAPASAEKLQLARAAQGAPGGRSSDALDDVGFAPDIHETFVGDLGQNLDSGYAWVILLAMFLLSASVGGASRVYGLVYAKQVAIGYYDHEQASWPIATASTVENLAGILTPALARFLSWRKIQLLSTSLFILANVGAHFSSSLLIDILCLGLIQGLALSINTVLALAINNDYFERYRTTAYGIIMSGSTCGTFVMGPLVAWILEQFENFRFAYLAIAAFFGLNIVLALFIVPREGAPNWTLCSLATIGATATEEHSKSSKTPAADLDEVRSQRSAGGASGRAHQHWPNRKVSQLASHFERKNSIASISVQCGISRQSSLSRSSSDWRAGGPGGSARRVGAEHKTSVHSVHPGGHSLAIRRHLSTAAAPPVLAPDPDQARGRSLIRVASGGGALAYMRKVSQACGPADTPTAARGGESGSEEAAREHKKSVISFRAPAVAYELELASWQHPRSQSDCDSPAVHQDRPGSPAPPTSRKTGPSDVTSSTATSAPDGERSHQHATATASRPPSSAAERGASLARAQQRGLAPPPTTCQDGGSELEFGRAGANSSKLDNNLEMDTVAADSSANNYYYNHNHDHGNDSSASRPERFNLASALELLKLPYLHCVWVMLSLYYLIARIFIIILTDFADDHGLEIGQSRQLLNYWSLGEIVGRIFLSSFIDLQWLSAKSCIVLTCGALSASIGLMVAVEGYYSVYALGSALVAALVSLEYMLINVLMVEYLGKSRVLGCYALGSLLSSLLLFGRPALIGLFRDQLGSYDGLLVLLAGLALAYALLFGLLEPLLVRGWPKPAQPAPWRPQ